MLPDLRLPHFALFLPALALLTSCHDRKSDTLNSELANTSLTLAPETNAAPPASSTPAPTNAPIQNMPAPPPLDPQVRLLRDAIDLIKQGHFDTALEKVNAVIQADPKNIDAYGIRGQIYSEMKKWDLAAQDYNTILQIDNKSIPAKFNLSELKFMQKAYDDARPGFAALESDPDWGDLASYKVFLCDLFGGHEDIAKGEFDGFNQVGSNPSFYFGNVAWYVFHKQPEDARSWLISGVRIYAPQKVYLYTSSLKELGYLPLPAPPPPQ